ncbi:SH3 domain-containing protein [Afifella pfennigii]|uniref:SH3 domain-containing protein n=1 Tax=Afifella pfennigii TaxID=209897 RepID=UPI00068BABB1|nr:SH3 domain-containing protein [Afifella pfennigii]
MRKRVLSPFLLAAMVLTGGPAALAQDEIRKEEVRFPAGQSGTAIRDSIKGRQSVSYLLGAEAGQRMRVDLRSSNTSVYFNVYEPGRGPGDAALATGDRLGPMVPDINRFDGRLPTSGTYTVSVYLYRNAARRGDRADFTLDVSITGERGAIVQNDYADGLQGGPDYWQVTTGDPDDPLNIREQPSAGARILGSAPDGTVLRNLGCRMNEGQRWCRVETMERPAVSGWSAGRYLREGYPSEGAATQLPGQAPASGGPDGLASGMDFTAVGNIPCARFAGQPMGSCQFGVVRQGNGNGRLTVFWPDGGQRVIHFEMGTPAYYDRSQADAGAEMTVGKEVDLHTVRIGNERFEIPEAVITGG